MSGAAAQPRRRRSSRILLVCEGNICRSPAAELLLDGLLAGLPVRIESAGLGAAADRPLDEEMRAAIASWGLDPRALDQHRARQLTPDLLERSDLVLTMTRAQRSEVVLLAPSRLSRTFTLGEFARLVSALPPPEDDGSDPGARLAALLDAALARRPLTRVDGAAEDIADPYRRAVRAYELTAAALHAAVVRAAPVLRTVLTPSDDVRASGAAAQDAPPPGTPARPERRSARER